MVSRPFDQQAKKRFGQNFLIDVSIIDAILSAVSPRPTDRVVEIGPGHGAITEGLAASGCALTLIELDRDLIGNLTSRFVAPHPERCQLIHQDVLTVNFEALPGPLRIVGNLPYNISTPLLFQLLNAHSHIIDIHVMLQAEVVARICAAPNSSAYGRLGVMIQAVADPEPLIDVPPDAFSPAPKVHSGVVSIRPNAEKVSRIHDPDTLEKLVRMAFSQRRKTLRNTLKDWPSPIDFEVHGVDPGARAETISVDTYVTLANALFKQGC